ncbi:N-acetylmuramoyl-l-alanine amidase family [Trichomonas vaginalis G3]|uniref:N-acetylmuramoyl-l-alanine amidase family n=1 Tax=Trichomonas vaginalis (strain ATCC PRA-98 / G3) TaxID=412133 RepID=UPI0021E5F3D3|nr:N-acetylmuramoyl-l-alanine amidase family [Trichomonas vaginalis G3]KAI5501281.1 N-acetylmuramoyl-l-alanine amidase family [Trichomonas vaginalis G3]
MAAGFFKKLWEGIKKAASWVHQKIIKPIANFLAPVAKTAGTNIGGVLGAKAGNPAMGAQAGNAVGGIAEGILNKIGGK